MSEAFYPNKGAWGYMFVLILGRLIFHKSHVFEIEPRNGLQNCGFMSVPLDVNTVYPKKYAHGFVVLCFVVVMQSFIMNSHEVFIHIHQGCIAGTGAIVRLPQCQWSKPDGYGKISQCITTTKHSKAKTVCIFLGIYYIFHPSILKCLLDYMHCSLRIYYLLIFIHYIPFI